MKPMEQYKLNYRMEARESGDEKIHRLFLYDDISSYGDFNWNTWDYEESETSAKHIRALLDEIPKESTIEVHLNSRGGEVAEGVTIYNLLRQKSQKDDCLIDVYVDGYAYSVAMTIAMAGDTIHMGMGTSMLIHNPWGVVAGNAAELRSYADQLDALSEASLQLYMNRAKNITREELKDMMDKETLMDPEMCLKYGFCDLIDKYEKQEDLPKDENGTVEQLRRQLKEQMFTRTEVEKMLSGLTAKAEALEIEKLEPEEPKQEEQKEEKKIGDTLIAALKGMSSHK